MRIKINASVGIKTAAGSMEFGSATWIEGHILMVQSHAYMETGSTCEIKLDLAPAGGWIYSSAQVLRAAPYKKNAINHVVIRMTDLSERDTERLESFSEIHQKRTIIRRPMASGISFTGRTQPPSESPAIPIREPQFQLSSDERRLTVRWRNERSFRQDWAMHLAHGRLPAECPRPLRRAFMLRVVLPNGFVATFPAEVGEKTHKGWNARFMIPVAARRRLETFAQSTSRTAASAK